MPRPITGRGLAIGGVLLLVLAEGLVLLFVGGLAWALRDLGSLGAPPSPEQLAFTIHLVIAAFAMVGLNVAGGVVFAVRRRGLASLVLGAIQVMDIGFIAAAMAGSAAVSYPSSVPDGSCCPSSPSW
ncbi:MAG: hypothetical protein ABSA40_03460 [Candidatus Dormibacteria bacterium]|jgi:hypothetical protein